jgi:hypothetical protein
MNDELTEADEGRQRAVIEEIIVRARPGFELRWAFSGNTRREDTETHVLNIQGRQNRFRLIISQDALEATDDPASIPRLEREIEKQLRISESAGLGYVRFPV